MLRTVKSIARSPKSGSSESGYNLLQLSLALMVIGVMIGSFFYIYNLYQVNQRILESDKNIQTAINTIQNYRNLTGAYPCPAPINAARDTSTYGHASKCQPGLTPVSAVDALAPGECGTTPATKGVCVEQSIITTLTNRKVIVGSIPFRELQIDETATFDGYNRRLVYAVTQSLTSKNTFDEKNGAIEVQNDAGQSLVDPAGSVSFLVLSGGATGTGAYTNTGALFEPCTGQGKDLQNCNAGFESGTSSTTNAVFTAMSLTKVPGAGFFDDLVAYFSQVSDPTWKRTDLDPEAIEDLSPNNVGIGTDTPSAALEIMSLSNVNSLRALATDATNGKIITDQICDNVDPTKCFTPNDIVSDTKITCPSGQYMSGIGTKAAKCISVIEVKCPDSTPVMTGIDSNGNPKCSPVPGNSCPEKVVTICPSIDSILPKSNDGTTKTIYAGVGSCRYSKYKCSNGTWSKTGGNNLTCNLSTTPYTVSKGACGPGYTGTFEDTYLPTCDGNGQWQGDNFDTACTCVGYTNTTTKTCASGASYTETTKLVCNPYSLTTSSTSGTACTCAAQPTMYSYSNCPSGQVRKASAPAAYFASATSAQQGIVTIKSFDSNPSACKYNSNTYNYCETVCDPTATQPDETELHTCANPTCEEPNASKPDIFSVKLNSTCTGTTKTLKTTGECKAKTFKWISYGTGGSVASTIPSGARYVGEGCSCSDYQDTLGSFKNCFLASDTSKQIYNCRCQ